MVTRIGIVIQARRGTTGQVAAFTPAQGEVVVDTSAYREVAGDGNTLGGFPVGRAQQTLLNNSSVYTVLPTDVLVIFTALSTVVTHTITLPPANGYPTGQFLRIQDGTTFCGSTNPIVINASSTGNADTINSTTTISISTATCGRTLFTNGTTGWFAIST